MAIFKHPDGTFHRYPFTVPTGGYVPATDEYTNTANWTQVPGAPPGVQIHRDGKTMRNVPSTA